MAKPYIKLYKKMLKWEWYDDVNTKVVFIHCLLKANWEETKWHGIVLQPGQFITSLKNLAKETHLSVSQVRVALNHLKMTNEIASKSHNKYTVITVNSWNEYQGNDKQNDKQVTNKQQTNDKQIATVKEYKELKERKDINSIYTKYSSSFSEFWKFYPRKQDKGMAYEKYLARLNDGHSEEELLTACKNYAAECERDKRDKKYIKHASTFLSVHEPFLDYLKGENNESVGTVSERDEEQRNAEIDETIRRIESGEADHDDDGLWDNLPKV